MHPMNVVWLLNPPSGGKRCSEPSLSIRSASTASVLLHSPREGLAAYDLRSSIRPLFPAHDQALRLARHLKPREAFQPCEKDA